MKIFKRLSRNLLIFGLAILFSFGIIFVIKHPSLLQASVLNASEISLIKDKQRDIAYKQNVDNLDIFYNGKEKNLTIVLFYDDSIVLKTEEIEGQCLFMIINLDQNSSNIEMTCENINQNESAIIIPFEGLAKNILLEEAFFVSNGDKNQLSVGNLTELSQHSN